MVDAAAVVANFHMMVRIADGTGVPLDEGTYVVTQHTRDALRLEELVATDDARRSRSTVRRALGRALAPAIPIVMRTTARLLGGRLAEINERRVNRGN